MEDIKKCGLCKEEKLLSFFNKCVSGTYGVHGHCRVCQSIIRKKWYLNNKQKELDRAKTEKAKSATKQRNAILYSDPEYRNKILEINRNRRKAPLARQKANEQRKRWLSIPHNKIAVNLRKRINQSVKQNFRSGHCEQLLSCSFEELKAHLEKKFPQEFTWENYGSVWHIDHIVPCSFFDLSDTREQQICFHYLNLQPLSAKENISKHNKINSSEAVELINTIKNWVSQDARETQIKMAHGSLRLFS